MRRNARPGYRRVNAPCETASRSCTRNEATLVRRPTARAHADHTADSWLILKHSGSACRYDAVTFEALPGSRARRIVALVAVLSIATAAAGVLAPPSADAASKVTALSVTSTGPALAVRGSDGTVHLDYDLVLTSMFDAPITLVSVDVLEPSGRRLLRLEGDTLAALTHPNFGAVDQPTSTVPPSGTV